MKSKRTRKFDLVRAITTVLGTAALTASLGIALLAPRTTHADDTDDREGEWVADGVKFGSVVIKGELLADTKSKTGWVLAITATNQSDAPATARIEEDLTRTFTSPAARVSPPATAIWKREETFTLAAHETTTRRIDVPAHIATQLTATERESAARAKLHEAAEKANREPPWAIIYAPIAVFSTQALRALPPKPQAPAAPPARPAPPAAAAAPVVAVAP